MIERVLFDGAAYIALPDARRERFAWVLACHGSGRKAMSYRDVPFYAAQRDIALKCGCAFAACDLGRDTFGTPEGVKKLDAFYNYMLETQPVYTKLALWGSSAGGLSMFAFARAYPERVKLMLGTFPIWDMTSVTRLDSLKNAWGGLKGDALLSAITPHNPSVHANELPGAPIVVLHGLNDKAVPAELNALALKRALPDQVSLHITQDEHSTQAFSLYDTPLLNAALNKMRAEQAAVD